MSKMLQEAILDAEALKEAAFRNAEQAIIEKYESEIKDAVTTLLEQPEDLELGEEDPMALGDDEGSHEDLAQQLPDAATDGENLCPCPEDEEQVTLDLDALVATAAAEEEEEEAADQAMGLPGGLALEEVDLNEELLAKIVEELTVDIDPQSDGWTGATTDQVEEAEEQAVAQEQDTEISEENEELRKNVKELEERLARTNKRFKILKEQKNKIKNITLKMRNHVDSVNLQNAKLLYTNRVLSSASLNERQKIKIAEAISSAKSVEEAKTIFETLQSTVGTKSKRSPKSLSEAVTRRSSILPRATKAEKSSDPATERMKILAGICKK